jgi:zinc protease
MNSPDRTKQPNFQVIKDFKLPAFQTYELSNGIKILQIEYKKNEVLKLDLLFRAGTWFQPKNLVASFTNGMISEGTLSRTSAQIAQGFDFYGSYIQQNCDFDFAGISLFSLSKHFTKTFELLGDIISNPVFPGHELHNYLNKRRQTYIVEAEKVRTIARKHFLAGIYPADHPYGNQSSIEDFDKVNRTDLADFHKKFYLNSDILLVIAGSPDVKIMNEIESYFSGFRKEVAQLAIKSQNNWKAPDLQLIQREGAIQSAIRIGRPFVNRQHPDFPALSLLVTLLGGYFGSRLMANIREDKGFTYGIGAGIVSMLEAGYFVIYSEMANEYVNPAIGEIQKELLKLIHDPISESELDRVKNFMLGDFIRSFDGPFQAAETLASIHGYKLDPEYYINHFEKIKSTTSHELQALAQKWLQPSDMFTVIAGNC